MGRSRTANQSDALERARAARLRLDVEREQRDRQIEDAAAAYFSNNDVRGELLLQVKAVEAEIAASLRRLRDLGESTARIAQLLSISAADVRKALAPVDAGVAKES
ncbi:MAG TPA: hypothetical protein VFE45_10130 [Coriobacteriia bacterium]|nr:hypothetical protein [Coriobacteriia bacterium]